MADIGELDIKVNVDSKEATEKLKKLEQNAKKAKETIEKATSKKKANSEKETEEIEEESLKKRAELTKELEQVQKKLDERLKKGKLTKTFKSLGDAFKRIAIYRGLRAVISAIERGLKTGVDNLYQFSKLGNGAFAQAMDKIATSLQYFNNSLGAALGGIIEQLAPTISNILMKIGDFNNGLSQMIAYMRGIDTYTRASTKAMKQYQAIVSQTIGIDELNVISDNGGGNNFSNMFEEVAVDTKEAEKWKKTYESIKGVVLAIAGGIGTLKLASFISDISELTSKIKTLKAAIESIAFAETTMQQATFLSGLVATLSTIGTITLMVTISIGLTALGQKIIEMLAMAEEEKISALSKEILDEVAKGAIKPNANGEMYKDAPYAPVNVEDVKKEIEAEMERVIKENEGVTHNYRDTVTESYADTRAWYEKAWDGIKSIFDGSLLNGGNVNTNIGGNGGSNIVLQSDNKTIATVVNNYNTRGGARIAQTK